MEQVSIGGIVAMIISLGSLLSVLLMVKKLVASMTQKAKEEGIKEEQFKKVQQDFNNFGDLLRKGEIRMDNSLEKVHGRIDDNESCIQKQEIKNSEITTQMANMMKGQDSMQNKLDTLIELQLKKGG